MRATRLAVALVAVCGCVGGGTAEISATVPAAGQGAGPPGASAPASPGDDPSSALERAIVSEINALRADPRGYASHLRSFRRHYRGRLIELPGSVPIVTQEGVAAVDEAIAALKRKKPLEPLRFERGLYRAARDHAVDIGRRGAIAHAGADGSLPHERMERYGSFEGLSAENIDFGFDDARLVILHLLVDDAVPDRGHRVNLLAPELSAVGVACAPHARLKVVCVMDFAEIYRSRR